MNSVSDVKSQLIHSLAMYLFKECFNVSVYLSVEERYSQRPLLGETVLWDVTESTWDRGHRADATLQPHPFPLEAGFGVLYSFHGILAFEKHIYDQGMMVDACGPSMVNAGKWVWGQAVLHKILSLNSDNNDKQQQKPLYIYLF